MKIIEFFLKQTKLLNLVVALIIGFGTFIFINGKKEAFPTFVVNQVFVNTLYLGAPARTVENLVTYPIENEIKGISGVEKIQSSSRENFSSIAVTIDPAYEYKLNDIKQEIQNKIDLVDLPDGVERPEVSIFDNGLIPVVRVQVAGGKDEWQRREIAKSFERQALSIPGVGGVSLEGYLKEEIKVECDPYLLKKKGLNIDDVITAIRTKNVNVPAGEIYQGDKLLLVRVLTEFSSVEEIEDIVIRANDDFQAVRVKDVARVYRGFEKATVIKRADGEKGIEIAIKKSVDGDNIKISDAVKNLVKQFEAKYKGVDFIIFNDTAVYVKNRLRILSSNAFLGLIFVVIVLFLFFDFTTSFWTVMGMPVAFTAAIIVTNFMGLSLNLMSMFGFIIVVGMIVDDAIVIAENIYSKLEEGLSPFDAAVQGTKEVIIPIFISIATTIAAFIPLLLISGTIGKFFGVIPKVVSITLIASFLEAIFVLPGHLYHYKQRRLDKGSVKKLARKTEIFNGIKSGYEKFISKVLDRKGLALGIFLGVSIMIMAFLGRRVPFKFSPGRVNEYSIQIEIKPDYSLAMTEKEVIRMEKFLLSQSNKVVQDVISVVGQTGNGQFLSTGDNKASIQVILDPDRPVKFDEIAFKERIIAEGRKNTDVEDFEVGTVQAGPPPSRPINVIVSGDDFNQVLETATEIRDFTKNLSNASDVRLDYEEGKREFILGINQVTSKYVGLSAFDIANAVRNKFDGGIATTIKKNGEDTLVRVKYDSVTSASYKTLKELTIPNRFGKNINFSQIGNITRTNGVSEIRHFDTRLTVSVLGNLRNPYDKKYTSSTINMALEKKFGKTSSKYPDIKIQYGGENEDMARTIGDLSIAYLVALFVIFGLLVGLFKNYSQTFIIMLTIPFGIIGVYIGLWINNMPLSYTSLIGVVALSGVVVNGAIILIDFINKRRAEGMSIREAVIDGSANRLRPVIMTTLTTVVGLVPMAYGWGGKEEFLQPLGVALLFGILFATILTLFFIPLVYSLLEDSVKQKWGGKLRGFLASLRQRIASKPLIKRK